MGKIKGKRIGIAIDMTPLVDVAFLLLIFFMVTTVFRTPKALEINLPPKDVSQPVPESKTMTLRVLADGRLYWRRGAKENPWNRSSMAQVKDVLKPFAGQNELIMVVKVDRDAEFANMVSMLDELHATHLTRFSITPLDDKEKQEVEKL